MTGVTEEVGVIRLGVLKGQLTVAAPYEYTQALSALGCGKWDKKAQVWVFPMSAVCFVVDAVGKENVRATEEVIRLLKQWRGRARAMAALMRGETELRPHPFLMRHQRVAREIATIYERYALFMDTGTGKTLTALQIIQDHLPARFLVLCPKALIKTAWMEDQEKWYPDLRLLPLSRNMTVKDYQRIADRWGLDTMGMRGRDYLRSLLVQYAQVFIINPESFKIDMKQIKELAITGLVLDESTILKNQSENTTTVTSFADTLRYCYIMSGKPDPNGVMNYYGQMRVVDVAVFGATYYGFRSRYFVPADANGWKWVTKEGAEKAIMERVAHRAYMVKKEECLDLPDKVYETRLLELPPKVRKMYDQMERDFLLVLNDESISAAMKGVAMGKCRQITGGAIINTETNTVTQLHRLKLDALLDEIELLGDRKVLIWAQYRHEVAMIAEELRKLGRYVVTANGDTVDLDASINAFKNGDAQFMVAHPATLKFGATFIKCSYVIYYSKSHDYEEYYQSHDRVYRKGQENKCTFISLVVDDSVDLDIEEAIKRKGNVSAAHDAFLRRVGGVV